jgi:hypothetical protein
LAKCKLEFSHPKFRCVGDASDADLRAGLQELADKVANDHKLSGFVRHPMKGFPDYQNKIWKWDFSPANDKSGTRKGWRLYALVDDPASATPTATAFIAYDKDQTPDGNHVTFLVEALKKFLTVTKQVQAEEDRFHRVPHASGQTVSVCHGCGAVIFFDTPEHADVGEKEHDCPNSLNA